MNICKWKKYRVTACNDTSCIVSAWPRARYFAWQKAFMHALKQRLYRFMTCYKRNVFYDQLHLKWKCCTAITDCSETRTSAFKLLKIDIKLMQYKLHSNNWQVWTHLENFLASLWLYWIYNTNLCWNNL